MAAVEAFLKMEASVCGLLDTNNYTIRGCFYLDDLDAQTRYRYLYGNIQKQIPPQRKSHASEQLYKNLGKRKVTSTAPNQIRIH